MSMYKQFKTNADIETAGVELDYGDFVITIARAGGGNKQYAKALESKTKPHRRAIQTEMMDPKRALGILMETYAEAVVIKWETRVDDELKNGIEPENGGELLPVTIENIVLTFTNLPDLFADVQEQANKVALFRESILEDDAGN